MLVNLDAKVQHTSMFVNLIHRPTTQIVFSILPLLGFIVPLSFVLIVVKLSNCRLYVSVFVLSISLFVLYLCLPNCLLFLEQITRFHLLLSCPCCTVSPVTQFRRIVRHRLSISFNQFVKHPSLCLRLISHSLLWQLSIFKIQSILKALIISNELIANKITMNVVITNVGIERLDARSKKP